MRWITTFAVAAPLLLILPACGEEEPETRHIDSTPQESAPARPAPPESGAEAADPTAPPSAETAAPTYAGVILSPPSSWIAEAPESTMRVGQFRIDNQDGADATLTILHFGERGAGPVDANLMRWAREVTDENDQPAVPEVEEFETRGLKVTTFRSRGTYAAAAPMGGSGQARTDSISMAAIIEGGPEGPIYLKLIGPADLLLEHEDAFDAMVRAARSTAAGASGG